MHGLLTGYPQARPAVRVASAGVSAPAGPGLSDGPGPLWSRPSRDGDARWGVPRCAGRMRGVLTSQVVGIGALANDESWSPGSAADSPARCPPDAGHPGRPGSRSGRADTAAAADHSRSHVGHGSVHRARARPELGPRRGDVLTARFVWDFGDPTGDYDELVGWNAAHTYDAAGQYVLHLTVTNKTGGFSTQAMTVNVAPDTRSGLYVAANGSDGNPGTIGAPLAGRSTRPWTCSSMTRRCSCPRRRVRRPRRDGPQRSQLPRDRVRQRGGAERCAGRAASAAARSSAWTPARRATW